jgi:hypothetical protein
MAPSHSLFLDSCLPQRFGGRRRGHHRTHAARVYRAPKALASQRRAARACGRRGVGRRCRTGTQYRSV